MKIKVFTIVFIGLSIILFQAKPQTVNFTVDHKVSLVAPSENGISCLDKLNTAIDFSYGLWLFFFGICNTAFQPGSAGLTECQIIANDTNTAMLQTDLNAFDRCNDRQY